MSDDVQLGFDGTEVPIETEREPLRITTRHVLVMKALDHARRPMTDDELVIATGMPGNSVRPRRGELVTHGYVQAAGSSRTPSGRIATRWGLTAKGENYVAPF